MAFGGAEFGLQAGLLATLHNPLGAGLHVAAVLGLGGDAGEADVIAEFVDVARFVLFQEINDDLHGGYVAGNWLNAKEGMCCPPWAREGTSNAERRTLNVEREAGYTPPNRVE